MREVPKLSDEKVVELVRTSNKELYAEIIRRYQDKLMRYAGYITGDREKGADAVQEAFIKAYINLNGFDINKKFSSWIYRIVHNEAMNIIKKSKKEQPLGDRDTFDSGIDLEDDFIKKELVNRAHRCLEKIPIIYKEPLALFYLEEKSYEEIGEVLRIPVGTVGTRINRAKIIMRKICQKQKR